MRDLGRFPWLVAALTPATAGCQRPLNYEKTLKMEPGDVHSFPVDAPQREQKVRVEVDAPGTLNVYVVRESDEEAARHALLALKKPTSTLAKVEPAEPSTTPIVLETTIPAKTGFVVILSGIKKAAEVRVKITGR